MSGAAPTIGACGDTVLRHAIRDALLAFMARTGAPGGMPNAERTLASCAEVAGTCLEFAAAAYASGNGDEEAFVRLARSAFALSAGDARDVAGNGEAGHW